MRILWDFRLFSLPYANRGAGVVTKRMCQSMHNKLGTHTVFILGDKNHIPPQALPPDCTFIKYKQQTWKHDLFAIPYLLFRHRIDVCHFWVGLGPIHQIGLPFFLPCRGIVTVLDMGVALWNDIPFLRHKKRTPYWRVQKRCSKKFHGVHFYSNAAKTDYENVFHSSQHKIITYPPLPDWQPSAAGKRKPYIVALGGAPHKNLRRTVAAFERIQAENKNVTLFIAGHTEKKELPAYRSDRVRFVSMDHYPRLLSECSVFVSTSYHEGLGLPMLEAMTMGCPMVLSSIPSHEEIAGEGAVFVDPYCVTSIQEGITTVLKNVGIWVEHSHALMRTYQRLTIDSPGSLIDFYERITHA